MQVATPVYVSQSDTGGCTQVHLRKMLPHVSGGIIRNTWKCLEETIAQCTIPMSVLIRGFSCGKHIACSIQPFVGWKLNVAWQAQCRYTRIMCRHDLITFDHVRTLRPFFLHVTNRNTIFCLDHSTFKEVRVKIKKESQTKQFFIQIPKSKITKTIE